MLKLLKSIGVTWGPEVGPCIICWNSAWAPISKDYIGDGMVVFLKERDYNVVCEYCLLHEAYVELKEKFDAKE